MVSSCHIPVIEMVTKSVSSNIQVAPDIATIAVDSSTKLHRKRYMFKRMIYGFAFSTDELEEWGRQRFGDTDDEKILLGYISKSMGPLFTGCYRLWRRTSNALCCLQHGPSPPRIGLVSHLCRQSLPRHCHASSKRNHRQDEGEPTHRARTSMVPVPRRLKDSHPIKERRVVLAVPCFCDLII